MKAINTALCAALLLLAIFTLFLSHKYHKVNIAPDEIWADTIYRVDTIRIPVPGPVQVVKSPPQIIYVDSSRLIAAVERGEPIEFNEVDGIKAVTDSSGRFEALEITRTEKTYETPEYKAVVSGIDPRLDFIETYRTTETIYNTEIYRQRKKRFGVGIQAGYGIGKNGLQPYLGVGVQYNIFRF